MKREKFKFKINKFLIIKINLSNKKISFFKKNNNCK